MSVSTRPDPERSGAVEIATRRRLRLPDSVQLRSTLPVGALALSVVCEHPPDELGRTTLDGTVRTFRVQLSTSIKVPTFTSGVVGKCVPTTQDQRKDETLHTWDRPRPTTINTADHLLIDPFFAVIIRFCARALSYRSQPAKVRAKSRFMHIPGYSSRSYRS